MGRAVLSQFLILSNSSPRLSSSLSCGGLRGKYLKKPGLIRHNRAIDGDNGAGFHCYCSVSLSHPAAPEASSSSVKKRIVSEVQLTGAIHLGNYLGAIKNWIALQNCMTHSFSLWTSMRLHYHMIHNNYLRQRGIQQLFIWHVVWTPQRLLSLCSHMFMLM